MAGRGLSDVARREPTEQPQGSPAQLGTHRHHQRCPGNADRARSGRPSSLLSVGGSRGAVTSPRGQDGAWSSERARARTAREERGVVFGARAHGQGKEGRGLRSAHAAHCAGSRKSGHGVSPRSHPAETAAVFGDER